VVRLFIAVFLALFGLAATNAPPKAYDVYKFDVRGLRLGDSPGHVIGLLSKFGAVNIDRIYCEASRIKAIKRRRDPGAPDQHGADCISQAAVRISTSSDIYVAFAEDLTKRNRPTVATKIQYTVTNLLPGDAALFEKHAIAKYGPPNNPDEFGWRGQLCGPDCYAPSLVITGGGSSITTILSDAGLVAKIQTVRRQIEQSITSSSSLTP
jgi:hypothetical protein